MGWSTSRMGRTVRLQPAERRAVLGAAALLVVVTPALKVLPMRRVRAGLGLVRRVRGRDGLSARRLGQLVEAAGAAVPGAHCLQTSLVGETMLRRRGLDATLHLGVRRRGSGLESHAWLEAGGVVVVGEAEREGFKELWVFTAESG